jgi:hypothetical protein
VLASLDDKILWLSSVLKFQFDYTSKGRALRKRG